MRASRKTWAWELISARGRISGNVMAYDPRDAMTRALTSETSAGKLLGEEFAIPVDALAQVPANFLKHYELQGDGFRLRVDQEAS